MHYFTDTDLYTIITNLNDDINQEEFFNNLQFQVINKMFFNTLQENKKATNELFKNIESQTNLKTSTVKSIKERFSMEIAKDKHNDIKLTKFFTEKKKDKKTDREKTNDLAVNLQLSYYFNKEEFEFLNNHLNSSGFIKNNEEFLESTYDNNYVDAEYMEEMKDTSVFVVCHNLADKLFKDNSLNEDEYNHLRYAIYFFKSNAYLLVYKIFLILQNKTDKDVFFSNIKDYLRSHISYDSLIAAHDMFNLNKIKDVSDIKLLKYNSLINFYNDLIDNIDNLPLVVQEFIVLDNFTYTERKGYNVSTKHIPGKLVKDLYVFYKGFYHKALYTLNIDKSSIFLYKYEFENCDYIKSITEKGIIDGFDLNYFNEATGILNKQFELFKNLESSDKVSTRNELIKPKIDNLKIIIDKSPKLGDDIKIPSDIHELMLKEINWEIFNKILMQDIIDNVSYLETKEEHILLLMLRAIRDEYIDLHIEYEKNQDIIKSFRITKATTQGIVHGFDKNAAKLKSVTFEKE